MFIFIFCFNVLLDINNILLHILLGYYFLSFNFIFIKFLLGHFLNFLVAPLLNQCSSLLLMCLFLGNRCGDDINCYFWWSRLYCCLSTIIWISSISDLILLRNRWLLLNYCLFRHWCHFGFLNDFGLVAFLGHNLSFFEFWHFFISWTLIFYLLLHSLFNFLFKWFFNIRYNWFLILYNVFLGWYLWVLLRQCFLRIFILSLISILIPSVIIRWRALHMIEAILFLRGVFLSSISRWWWALLYATLIWCSRSSSFVANMFAFKMDYRFHQFSNCLDLVLGLFCLFGQLEFIKFFLPHLFNYHVCFMFLL